MIVEDIKNYDGSLIHKRFAYEYFRNHTLPTGNIIAFRGKMDVGIGGMIDQEDVLQNDTIYSDDSINFCWEIPEMCKRGAVAFQRYFNAQIASVLSSYIEGKIELDGDDIMVHNKFIGSDNKSQSVGKCSVSITYSKDNVAIGHTGINVNAGRKAPPFAYSTGLNDEQCTEFMNKVIGLFYSEMDSIFIATTKINID